MDRSKFRHTGDNARSGLTLAELLGVPDVPEETALRLLVEGADLGDAAKKRAAERHKQDLHADRAHKASLTKAEKQAPRRAIALAIAKELRAGHPRASIQELSKIAHARMTKLEPETGFKAYKASGFENLIPRRKPL